MHGFGVRLSTPRYFLPGKLARIGLPLLLLVGLTTVAAASWWSLTMPVPDERLTIFANDNGKSLPISVDVFLPDETDVKASRHPAVVILHGVEGATRYASLHYRNARRLNSEGYAVFFVHYFDSVAYDDLWLLDDKDKLRVDEIAQICKQDANKWTLAVTTAIERIARRNDINPDLIALEGFSLGGYVSISTAAQLCASNQLPDAAAVVVNWGAKFQETPLSVTFPPTFFVHGENDEVVPLTDARATLQLMQAAGIEAELHVVPAAGHTAASMKSMDATFEFLSRHLKPRQELASFENWAPVPVPAHCREFGW